MQNVNDKALFQKDSYDILRCEFVHSLLIPHYNHSIHESHRKHLTISILNKSYFHLLLTTLLFLLPLALGIQSPTTSANYGNKKQAQKVSNIPALPTKPFAIPR